MIKWWDDTTKEDWCLLRPHLTPKDSSKTGRTFASKMGNEVFPLVKYYSPYSLLQLHICTILKELFLSCVFMIFSVTARPNITLNYLCPVEQCVLLTQATRCDEMCNVTTRTMCTHCASVSLGRINVVTT